MALPCHLGTCPTLLCADPPCPLPKGVIPTNTLYEKGVLPPANLLHIWPSHLPLDWADKPAGFITEAANRGAKWAKRAVQHHKTCQTLDLRCTKQMMEVVLLLQTISAAYPEALKNYESHKSQCEDAIPSCERYLKSLQKAHWETQRHSKYNWEKKCPKRFPKSCPPHSRNARPYR